MKSKNVFPLRVEKNGVTVLVYRHKPASGYLSYVVTHHIGGSRQRKSYSDLGRAKREAKTTAKMLAMGEASALELRNHDRLIYVRALESIKPLGVELDNAAADYAEAVSVLKGRGTLRDAVQHFLRTRPAITNKRVDEVLAETRSPSSRRNRWI